MVLYNQDINRLIQVQEYINSNLSADLKAAVICVKFAIGEHTLRRQFREYFNISLHQYVLNSRMHKAYELLCNKVMPVSEVAIEIGYHDVSTFSHAFSGYFGVAPTSCGKSDD